ncbi:hypothetical protein D6C91_04688 [Aureobasidium pullulans]|uniref:Uncharacterized protein n=1 Tax=Aureobasidium pullulans TaxID=5580 RepID=A0A4S9T8N2_AURPU|nr:hypothetical protein D6C91_04688 [Aureobasidium pullulans]
MADNTHPMSTRRSLKTDRASIINPTAVTSHKAITNTPATTTATPTATANSTPKTPPISKPSTRKSKAVARNTVKPTTRSSAGGKAAVKQPPSDEAPDVEMQDEEILPSTASTTSTSKAASTTKIPIPEKIPNSSPEVKMQDSTTSPPITSPFFKPKSAMKKPAIKQCSPASTPNAHMQNVESSPISRPKAILKPKASKRRTVSFGGATSEAATQTESADVPVVQRVHDVYPNLPAGVPRDGDGVRESTLPKTKPNPTKPTSHYFSHINGTLALHQQAKKWPPTLMRGVNAKWRAEVKMMTNEFSNTVARAKDARKCTGGDECGDHCPLFGAEGHGDWKMG